MITRILATTALGASLLTALALQHITSAHSIVFIGLLPLSTAMISHLEFMILGALIVFFLWRMIKLMPRTKPQEIKPESDSSIGWPSGAGTKQTIT